MNKQLHMASMFDLTDNIKESQGLMAECDENLTSMNLLWDLIKVRTNLLTPQNDQPINILNDMFFKNQLSNILTPKTTH